jgi:hypothetical protein
MAKPLTIRANNPGALRPIKGGWEGQTGTTPGASGLFAVFSSPEYGVRAFFLNARTQISRGNNTISKFLEIYAPEGENKTENYISFVSQRIGGNRDTKIDSANKEQMFTIARAIFEMESGVKSGWELIFNDKVLNKGWEMYLRYLNNKEVSSAPGKEVKDAESNIFSKPYFIVLLAVAAVLLYKYFKK